MQEPKLLQPPEAHILENSLVVEIEADPELQQATPVKDAE